MCSTQETLDQRSERRISVGIEATAVKYDAGVQLSGKDWLCLHRNENLFVDPNWAIELTKNMAHRFSISLYPDPECGELRAAIAELYGVSSENVFVGNGSDEVLSDLLALLRDSYERIATQDVCFNVYYLLARRFNYHHVKIPGNTFLTGQLAVEDWDGLSIVDSPNSVTGVQLNHENLLALKKNDHSFLIWDNAYGEFAGDVPPSPIEKNVVLVRSFSKFYGLAGLRIGYCIAHSSIIKELLERKDIFNVNAVAQLMALEALQRREELMGFSSQMIECRNSLVNQLQNFGFQVHKPSGNFVLTKHPTFSGQEIESALLKYNVAVRRFPGKLTENHVRITVPPVAGLSRLAHALEEVLNSE